MADVFFIYSENPEIVDQTRSAVEQRLAILTPGCVIDRIDGPNWSLTTSRNPFVPYAASHDAGGIAVVIGSTYDSNGAKLSDLRNRLPAERIRAMREYCRQLNFGMALCVQDHELLVTSDWLGLYPIYYYHADSTLIVTSIPGLLHCFGRFRPALDIQGLVGILLLAHSCLGRTLYQGVTRLKEGRLLKYEGPCRKITLEEVPLSGSVSAPKNFDEAVNAFDDALSSAIREASKTTHSVYLSGGLDSRIVAGYLRRFSTDGCAAITMGEERDIEMRAAARVVSAIGAAHEMVSVNQSNYQVYAQRSLDHDTVCSGLYLLNEYHFSDTSHPPVFTGFLGDVIVGAEMVDLGREHSCDIHTFYQMFKSVNLWGLSPGIVRELVRVDDIDDMLLEVYRQLRDEYYSYSGEPWQKSWWFNLHHRQRFIIGEVPKIIAMRSWPVLPYASYPVIQLAAATPLSLLSDRKVQIELIFRKFPELAMLPLVRDIDYKYYTIGPRKVRVWTPYIDRVKDSVSWHLRHKFNFPERRVFMRTFDFNGPGWKILRDKTRACAQETDLWLNKEMVLKLIPPSSKEAQFKLVLTEPTGLKALIGSVLSCSQYFATQVTK